MFDLLLVGFTLASVVFAVFIAWRHHHLRAKNDDLLTGGVAAQARVVRLRPEGTEDDLFIVALEVERPASSPVAVEVQLFIPPHALPGAQPGKTVPIRHDAANPARAILDLRAMGLA